MDKKILHNVLDLVSMKCGDSIAIEEGGRKLKYTDFLTHSNMVANGILDNGSGIGGIIGVFIPAGIEYTYSIVGISKAGGIFMPLEVAYPVKRLEYLVNQASPAIIITTRQLLPELFSRIKEFETKPFFLKQIFLVSADSEMIEVVGIEGGEMHTVRKGNYSNIKPETGLTGNDSLYLLNTSGSTGNPKMILGMHKSLSHFIHWEVQEFKLGPSVKICQLARTSFDLSLREIFVPLMAGGTLCIPTEEIKGAPAKLLKWLGSSQVNLIHIVPSVFRVLVKEMEGNMELRPMASSIEYILLAGEAVLGRDIEDWKLVSGEKALLVNMYGPSETTLAKVFLRIDNKDKYESQQIIPLGRPLPNTDVIILADGKLCNPGSIGEIHIRTPFRSKGYFNDPEMTAEKFIQNPLHNEFEDIVYRTGDLGKYLDDNVVAFAGRQDSQVKIRGNRVELSEVEQTLLKCKAVKAVIVMPIKTADKDNILACYYIAHEGLEENKLRHHLGDYLPEYMHPSYYIRMEEFPLNLNGKIEKKMLPRPEELLYQQLKYEAAADDLESRLAGIWSELLGLKKVGVCNAFFELGGHSLTLTRMLTHIYKETGVEIGLKEAFENATIRELACLIRQRMKSTFLQIEKAPVQDYYDLSYAQKAIWIGEHITGREPVYNIPYAYIIKGVPDTAICEEAFRIIIDRHEILRTTFDLVDGEPRQIIHPTSPFRMLFRDEPQRPEKEEFIWVCLEEASQTRFSLAEGPLIRAELIRTGQDEYLLVFVVHHIIFDGWSNEIFIREFIHIYNTMMSGQETMLPPLKLQYKDYTTWHNNELNSENALVWKQYWLSRLNGDILPVKFPADFQHASRPTFNGQTVIFDLDEKLMDGIRELSTQNAATPFMTCLAITSLLLYKYTGQSDMVIGVSVAGRGHKDLEGQIGMYVNILPIRIIIGLDDTLGSLLHKIKNWLLEAYDHQLYPHLKILEDLQLTGDNIRAPFLDILVQSGDMPLRAGESLQGLIIHPYERVNLSSKADLTFDFLLSGYQLSIEYNTDLFLPDTIREIYNNMLSFLEIAIKSDSTNVRDLKLELSVNKTMQQEAFKKLMSDI